MSKTICIDFDGVLHSYSSGWQGVGVVKNPPVPGAIQFLRTLIQDKRFTPVVYSARSSEPAGISAMQAWLLEHGLSHIELECLQFPTQKPGAWLTIDDRAICFDGNFPDLETLDGFRPWNRQ